MSMLWKFISCVGIGVIVAIVGGALDWPFGFLVLTAIGLAGLIAFIIPDQKKGSS